LDHSLWLSLQGHDLEDLTRSSIQPAGGDPAGGRPRVAAIVPCFNAGPLLGRSLESVLTQTRPIDEVVVVDDGSTDDSAAIAARFPVRLLATGERRGVSAARNAGLRASTSPLIAWLDADDRWDPHHCETLVDLIERHPDAAVASSRARFEGRPGDPPWGLERDCPGPESVSRLLWLGCAIPIMASVTRRHALLSVGGFREQLPAAVDYDLWLRLSLDHLFVWTTEITASYRWRLSPSQISAQPERQLQCMWRSRLLAWHELDAHSPERAAEVLPILRVLWASELTGRWRRRDVARLRALCDLPEDELLDSTLWRRLRSFLDVTPVEP
jgi:hypothetical protein